jgi:hypothetical protein
VDLLDRVLEYDLRGRDRGPETYPLVGKARLDLALQGAYPDARLALNDNAIARA